MIREPVPEDIRRFILLSVASVPHLEAILLLRSMADHSWTEKTVAERLYISEKAAGGLLGELQSAGFIVATESSTSITYRYGPNSESLRQTIDRLAECYSKNLLEVTNIIHSKIDRKAQQFADAFKWRKDS